jgi:hypothetical protein
MEIGLAFVSPDLVCALIYPIFILWREFPDDIRESVLCVVEERLEIFLPRESREPLRLLQAWRRRCGQGGGCHGMPMRRLALVLVSLAKREGDDEEKGEKRAKAAVSQAAEDSVRDEQRQTRGVFPLC